MEELVVDATTMPLEGTSMVELVLGDGTTAATLGSPRRLSLVANSCLPFRHSINCVANQVPGRT